MKAKKAIQTIFATTIFFLLLLTPILHYTYNETHYLDQMEKHSVQERKPEAPEYYANIIGFLKGQNELEGNYTYNERSHMEDVKKLYNAANTILYASIIIITGFAIIGIKRKERKEYYTKPLIYGSATLLGLNIIILITATLSFTTFFTGFHEIFFPMGNWQFPYDSTLITLFPREFFVETTQKIILTSTMLGIITLLTTRYIRKK